MGRQRWEEEETRFRELVSQNKRNVGSVQTLRFRLSVRGLSRQVGVPSLGPKTVQRLPGSSGVRGEDEPREITAPRVSVYKTLGTT